MNFLAYPLWVNLLLVVPIVFWFYWRKNKINIDFPQLLFVTFFGIAFGFIECACVIYIRASTNFLPGYSGSLGEVQKQSINFFATHQLFTEKMPLSLLTVEVFREAGTIIMLVMLACIATKYIKERIAFFLLAFALWDLFYYVFLYLTVRWPQSLTTKDILFLIPQPWIAEVWLPMLVGILIITAIFFNTANKNQSSLS